MIFNVKALSSFGKHAKKLFKKYPSLQKELLELVQSLKANPKQGDALGNDCYKIRMAIASKGKGRSGGGRVITCVKIIHSTVYLVTIYDKSVKEDITDKELNDLLKELPTPTNQ
jgi:mRNA-degrading endonuclease RelE of RelBE toxin-antitoxin system